MWLVDCADGAQLGHTASDQLTDNGHTRCGGKGRRGASEQLTRDAAKADTAIEVDGQLSFFPRSDGEHAASKASGSQQLILVVGRKNEMATDREAVNPVSQQQVSPVHIDITDPGR